MGQSESYLLHSIYTGTLIEVEKPSASAKIGTSLTTIMSLVIILFLPYFAFKTFFADSEIWSITLGYHFLDEIQNYWVFSRSFFYALVFAFTKPFSDSQNIFFGARSLMILNAIAQLFLLFKIIDHHFKNRLANWVAILILVANTFYLTQVYRVRSDLIATTFFLGTILALCKIQNPRKNLMILLFGAVAILLVTPKAVFLLPCLTILYLFESYDKRKWNHALALIGGLVIIYLSTVFLRLGVLSDLTIDLNNYLRTSLGGGNEIGIPYFSKKAFTYVIKLFSENAWLICIWLLPYILIHKKTNKKWLAVHTYLLILIFLAPEKLPFFICSLLPLLACSTTLLVAPFFIKTKSRVSSIIVVCSVLAISGASFWKIVNFIHSDSNKEQLTALKSLDNYLNTYPEIRYYDVVGLSPAHAYFRHFAGPNQPDSNRLVAKIIEKEKPDVLLRVSKFDYFGASFTTFMDAEYIHVGNGFYVRAFPVPDELKNEDNFIKIKDKKELVFLSPLFEKFKHNDLIFEARDSKGMRYTFTSIKNMLLNKPQAKLMITKVSPVPMPEKLPPRNLRDLFRFDTEF